MNLTRTIPMSITAATAVGTLFVASPANAALHIVKAKGAAHVASNGDAIRACDTKAHDCLGAEARI